MKNSSIACLVTVLMTGVLAGCSRSGGGDGKTALDNELFAEINAASLTGDPIDTAVAAGVTIPEMSDPKVILGKMLFFSKEMSFGRDDACVSCHHPVFGGGDNLALPIGVDPNNADLIGPGRIRIKVGSGAGTDQIPPYASNGVEGNPAMPRNSPTIFGLAFWDQSITWDGTVYSDKGSAGKAGTDSRIVAPIDTPPVIFSPPLTGFPGTHAALSNMVPINYSDKFGTGMLVSAGHGMFPASVKPAMRGKGYAAINPATGSAWTDLDIRKDLAARFNTSAWLPLFRTAYLGVSDTNLVTPNNISTAIAMYERTMTLTNTPWRAYVKGNLSALSDQQKRGALLFLKDAARGGANCSSCHKGDFFTDEKNYVLAIPQVGRGKADNNGSGDNNDDWGRGHVTGLDEDKYAYRVPTLLNVEVTAPYGHSGVYPTLSSIIRHHSNVANAVAAFNYTAFKAWADPPAGPIDITRASTHTDLALAKLNVQRAAGKKTIQDTNLNDAQVIDLEAFLKSLTDPCTKDKSCLAKWVPMASENTFDTQRVCPRDVGGQKLIAGSC